MKDRDLMIVTAIVWPAKVSSKEIYAGSERLWYLRLPSCKHKGKWHRYEPRKECNKFIRRSCKCKVRQGKFESSGGGAQTYGVK